MDNVEAGDNNQKTITFKSYNDGKQTNTLSATKIQLFQKGKTQIKVPNNTPLYTIKEIIKFRGRLNLFAFLSIRKEIDFLLNQVLSKTTSIHAR